MLEDINWEKVNGLLPAIIQSSIDQSILMLGYMSPEALELTKKSGIVHFYSRTKKRIWKKGEESGNILTMNNMHLDCDGDALVVVVTPKNNVCHKGSDNCFGMKISPINWLVYLETIVAERIKNGCKNSYIRSLVEKGLNSVAQKVGEEGVEVAIASVQKNTTEIVSESADLFFHLLLNLKAHKLDFSQVIFCLQQRHKTQEGK